MVESLDPHSEFLESSDNQELEEEMSGKFGGIGIQVEIRQGRVVVIAPIAGTPASEPASCAATKSSASTTAGREGCDDGCGRRPAARRAEHQGERRLLPAGDGPDLRRDADAGDHQGRQRPRRARAAGRQSGYLQLTEFSEHTGEEFARALDRLLQQDGSSSLVLDLRDNPGGLLDAAVDVAEPFFRKGELIVYTQGRKAADREEYRSEAEGRAARAARWPC